MAQPKRIIALVLMTLVSTVIPATYQKGLEPRIEAANCRIYIQAIEMDEVKTIDGQIVFKAYLRIENDANVEVTLSRLSLDVYHRPEEGNRARWVGTMNTTSEYIIPASTLDTKGNIVQQGYIQSNLDSKSYFPYSEVSDPMDLEAEIDDYIIGAEGKSQGLVVAELSFYQDKAQGQGTTEAIGKLLEREQLTLIVKGIAKVGPLEFEYEQIITLVQNLWDKNIMIVDVFNYYQYPEISYTPRYSVASTETDYNVIVVRARMRNPSTVPLVIMNYSFDLLNSTGQKIAQGLSVDQLALNAYDPDYIGAGSRRNIIDLYLDGRTSISLPPRSNLDPSNEWQDILLAFNFTDPAYPFNPNDPNSNTKNNMKQFVEQVFSSAVISGFSLQGRFTALLGYMTNDKKRGISVDIGLDETNEFRLSNVMMYQAPLSKGFNYTNYFTAPKKSLIDYMTIGKMNVSKFDINRQTNDINLDISASLLFENPYRFQFSMTNLYTDYYHLNATNYGDMSNFADGTTGTSLSPIIVNKANVFNSSAIPVRNDINWRQIRDNIIPTVSSIPNNVSLTYNTDDFTDPAFKVGLTKMFDDLGIDTTTLNLTNPLWLLGPEGIEKDGDLNPMLMVEYLIQKGIDPLMLLKEVKTYRTHHYGDNAYMPLKASFFGTNSPDVPLNDNNRYTQSYDFPLGNPVYSRNYYSPKEILRTSTWSASYPEVSLQRQYEIVKQLTPNGWLWYGDGILSSKFTGLMCDNLNSMDVYGWPASALPTDKISWRFYADDNRNSWGYAYDVEDYLRNWYIVHNNEDNPFMARQDFQLDMNKIQNIENIKSAKLSISYRYPNGDGSSGSGRVGIGAFNKNLSSFIYTNEKVTDNTASRRLWTSGDIFGFNLVDVGTPETIQNWQHQAFDVTWHVRRAVQNYTQYNDPDWLRMEVAFSCVGDSYMFFDDVVLEIEYYSDVEEKFRLKDMFDYIEKHDKVNGNAFAFLDSIGYDPVKMMAFMESDMGINPNPSLGGSNATNFFHSTDTSINKLISLMSDPSLFPKIEAGENLNFFDLLNYTRYGRATKTNNVTTPYGYRSEIRKDGWVIEDPYTASKAILDALKADIFVDSYGFINQGLNMYGKELWFLLENLNIDFAWVIVYLYMNGWSKDDIFDLLEACGFLREVKTNYYDVYARSQGYIREEVLVSATLYLFGVPIIGSVTRTLMTDVPQNLTANLGNPIDDSSLKLYQYLDAEGTRNILRSEGPVFPPQNIHFEPPIDPIDLGWFGTITGYLDMDLDLTEYEVHLYIENNPGSRIAPPYSGYAYLQPGGQKGLSDAGAGMLTNLLRQTVTFGGAPFLQLSGDPIGLFTFLDQYFFTATTPQIYGQTVLNDYSSYVLLNYLDVTASDFFEIISGYDQFTGQFDPNGNGKADDWRPPMNAQSNYNWISRNTAPKDLNNYPMRGWGIDPKNDRIYWNAVHPYTGDPVPTAGAGAGYEQWNGKIIWSDSQIFLDDMFYVHPYNGKITNVNLDFQSGAPPLVNLIDMLAWLSRTTEKLSPKRFFDWLEGKMTFENYLIQDPTLYNVVYPPESYDHGIGLQKIWTMLNNMTLNMTGFFNWFQNVKGANPFKLMYELNNWFGTDITSSPDPMDLFYYIQNPNFVIYPDGGVGFVFHDALGGSGTNNVISRNNFWNMFNGSWWAQNGGIASYWNTEVPLDTLAGLIFNRLREMEIQQKIDGKQRAELTYNLFQMLIELNVLPDDWLLQIETLGVLPFELLGVYSVLNFTQILRNAAELQKKTKMKVNGTLLFQINGMDLFDFAHTGNIIQYALLPSDITAAYHLLTFIDPYAYSTEDGTFAIYH